MARGKVLQITIWLTTSPSLLIIQLTRGTGGGVAGGWAKRSRGGAVPGTGGRSRYCVTASALGRGGAEAGQASLSVTRSP